MFKLVLEKAEEPKIKLPTSAGSSKKTKEFQKNIYFCFIDYGKASDYVDHNKLWKILKEMGIPDHLTCLLRNLYAGQEATVRTEHETTDWFEIGKGVCQGCILSPYLFNLYAEYIMKNARLEEAQAGIKIARRNFRSLRYVDHCYSLTKSCQTLQPHGLWHAMFPFPSLFPRDYSQTPMAESVEELRSLCMRVKDESEKVGLIINI